MNRRNRAFFSLLIICILICLPFCGCGNGSEVPNGMASAKSATITTLTGTARENRKPQANIVIMAIETGYIPSWGCNDPVVRTRSDSLGNFTLPILRGVSYNIILNDTLHNLGSIIKNISVGFGDTIFGSIGPIELDSLGIISGQLAPDTSRKENNYTIYLPGTPYFAKIDDHGRYTLVNIPAETYPLVLIVSKSSAGMSFVKTPIPHQIKSSKPMLPPVIATSKVIVRPGVRMLTKIGNY